MAPCLPDYNENQRGFSHDREQWTYQESIPGNPDLHAWRTITCLTGGPSGTPVRVTENGELVTTASLSADNITLNVSTEDGLNKYGEVNTLTPSSTADIVEIIVPAGEKINIMGYHVEGSGLGDYRLLADGLTQSRKIKRKSIDTLFGTPGITFNGPVTISLNVMNIEISLTSPCKNKDHTYFGNIFYTLESISP